MRKVYYFDKETGECRPGYPPSKNVVYGQAPYFISDTTAPYRHPMTGVMTDSKSAIRAMDEVTGCFTTDKFIPGDLTKRKEADRERREDIKRAMLKSVAQLQSGTAPLSEEQRAQCKIRDETVASALGRDVFNFCTNGKVKDGRGKKYRR